MMIELRGVTVGYGGEPVLRGVRLVLRGPGLVQILGPNGAGKTTLLKTMLGLIKPMEGRVFINGEDVTGRPERAGRHVGYVPQLAAAARSFPITAWELVETECLLRCARWPRLPFDELRGRVQKVLERVGLPREAWRMPLWSLSGGQRQRVLIARALVHDPEILVMDEPLSAVDPVGKAELASLVGRLGSRHLVVVTSHDPMLLLPYTTMVVLVNRGIVAAGEPGEVLRPEVLSKVYGGAVIHVQEHYHIADEHHHVYRPYR